jgi:hypothetical protein
MAQFLKKSYSRKAGRNPSGVDTARGRKATVTVARVGGVDHNSLRAKRMADRLLSVLVAKSRENAWERVEIIRAEMYNRYTSASPKARPFWRAVAGNVRIALRWDYIAPEMETTMRLLSDDERAKLDALTAEKPQGQRSALLDVAPRVFDLGEPIQASVASKAREFAETHNRHVAQSIGVAQEALFL